MFRRMLTSRWMRRLGRPYGAPVQNDIEEPKNDDPQDGVGGPVLSDGGVVVSAGVAAAPRNAPAPEPTVSPGGVVVSPGDPAASPSTAVVLADAPGLRGPVLEELPSFPEEDLVLERLAGATAELNDPWAAAMSVFVVLSPDDTE